MCCEFSDISFLKERHSVSMTCSGFNFLLLVAWRFLFLDVLLLMSLTLYLYIGNNNNITELVPGLANYPGQPVLGFDNTSVPEYIKDLL